MKKTIFVKSLLVILVSIVVAFSAGSVYAAEGYNNSDLLSSNSGSTSGNSNSNSNNSNSNSNNSNSNSNRNNANTNNSNALRTNNTNTYNNTNLPKTGIQDSLPMVLLVVVFGISAVYAYKKIKDYRNI